MPATAAVAAPAVRAPRYPIDALLADLGDMPVTIDPVDLRRKSRDFFWTSPIPTGS